MAGPMIGININKINKLIIHRIIENGLLSGFAEISIPIERSIAIQLS
jgi:hypothetical protein